MSRLNEKDLPSTTTDMMAEMLGNTEKLLSSNKRWNYADHKDDDMSDEMDVDADQFAQDSKNKVSGVFNKPDENSQETKSKNDVNHGLSDRQNEKKQDSLKKDAKTESEVENTMTEQDTETPKLSRNDLMLLKLDMLRKLGELKQCGVHLSQNYNLDSDLSMMEYEYKLHHDIRSKQNSVQWMSHMMIGCVKGVEFINDSYNPFEMKLSGLTDKISTDMHNYYSVLGDIYEQYNKPGKQMHPVLRLFLMLSGAALSIQANRIMTGGSADVVKSEQNLNELRKKAEDESNKKINEQYKREHDAAAQKAIDIKMIQDKELEFKKTAKMMDEKNTNMKNFKENLILSSEAPSKDTHRSKTKKQDDNNNYMTKDEMEMISQMRYKKEQEHLEMLRKTSSMKSDMFRQGMTKMDAEERRRRELIEQNKHLDNLLSELNKDTRSRSSDDRKSTMSSASTSSVNPKIGEIMKKTSEKAKRESMKKLKEEPTKPTKTTKPAKTTKPVKSAQQEKPIKQTPNKKTETAKKLKKAELELDNTETSEDEDNDVDNDVDNSDENVTNYDDESESQDIKFDKNIQMLLDNDDLSGNNISVGSRSKKSSMTGSKSAVSNSKSEIEAGTISIGSKVKGVKKTIHIGKK